MHRSSGPLSFIDRFLPSPHLFRRFGRVHCLRRTMQSAWRPGDRSARHAAPECAMRIFHSFGRWTATARETRRIKGAGDGCAVWARPEHRIHFEGTGLGIDLPGARFRSCCDRPPPRSARLALIITPVPPLRIQFAGILPSPMPEGRENHSLSATLAIILTQLWARSDASPF